MRNLKQDCWSVITASTGFKRAAEKIPAQGNPHRCKPSANVGAWGQSKGALLLGLILFATTFGSKATAAVSGQLKFLDGSDAVTTTYQAGDTLKLQVTDADRNSDAAAAETVTVLVTSNTENTGAAASVGTVTAGSNSGDGTVVVSANGFDTTSETWTLTAASQTSFIVSGSVAGNQRGITLDSASSAATYTSDNGEITLTVTPGSSSFSAGDTFSFTTTAAERVGETVTLTETGVNTGVFTKSMTLNDTATPSAGNGAIELVSGDRITAFYTDPAGDFGTAEYKRAQAFYAKTVVGGRTLIGDTIWGASGSPYLVTGDVTVDTGVTLVIQAGVKVLFLANSDDQSSGQRLSDSELLVKGTLSAVGTAEAPVVLSSSNAVASAGDWGGIYLEQNANLTLTYAHLSYTGYGINSVDNIKSVGITHSRLEFSGGGINLNRSYDQTSTRVITDNVINVGTSDHALTLGLSYNAADPIPNISRNTITNPQGHGIYVRNAYQGLTIDANTIAVKYTGIQVSSAGGVVAITNNILDNTSTSNWEKGSGVYVSSLRANGGADNAITSVTLQNNTIKKFGGSAGLYFNGNNQSITSSITGNTITDSDRQGVSIYNLQGTSITGNTVTGSAYAGVYLQNAVPSAFKDNVITGNGTTSNQPGLYISHSNAELSESFLIKDNDLSGNHIGIELRQFANAVVTGNDLSGSTTYGLNNLTTNAIDARYNYWGTSETTTLNAGGHPKALSFIYDGRDDAQYGSVNYAGWQTTAGGAPSSVSVAGQLKFLDGSDAVTTTYQAGDTLKLQVTDADRNSDAGVAETVTVLVTSNTENTGAAASVGTVTAGSNSGDGTVVVVANGFDTTSETWTLTAASQTSFIVSGSVAGNQRGITLDSASSAATYTSDNGEITLTVTPGSSSFSAGDTFSFTTTAAERVGETVTLTETGVNTGVFTKSMALNDTATPSAGNGAVELVSGDRITAFYTDTAGDFGTAEYKRAQAFYAKTVVGGRTLIGDTIWGASGSPYLVTGDVTVDTGVTLVIQAGVKVLFLANSDDQSSGQRLSDSELLVKGTLSAVGTAEAPVVLSSSNAVASAGDWGGIYLEQNANLTLTYAHLSYTGYGINSVDNIKSVGITHSRLEFSGGGINLNRSYDQTSTRVITDNVINVGTSDHALTLGLNYNAADPIPNISRNTITNPQGHGIYVRNAYQGLTIDANTIAVKYTGIQVSSAGGVVAITNNILDNTSTSNWEKGSGVYVSSLRANGGADNAITSVTLQNNTIKKFGGSAGLYFNGNNQSITSSITGNTITDSDRQGVSIYNLQGTSITGNTVTGSAYAGVYLQNAVPSAFKDNVITGNGTTSNQPGLYISHSNAELSESFLIKDNDLSGNHIGIELRQFANAVVTGNDLSGSTTYGLNNLTTNAIDARYNYWGTSETTTLNAGGHPKALSFIYDGRDDAQYGSVNYAGWQTTAGGAPSSVSVAGQLKFLDGSDAVTTTYQAGDTLKLQVTDADRNSDAGVAETVTVLVTSNTENTGAAASVGTVTAGSNSGDGTVVVVANGFDTTSETWTLTAASQTSFIVSGSVAGNQRGITLDSASSAATYTSDNGEITLTVTPGSSSFSAGDTFSFTTTAAERVGETVTLTETGVNTGVFTKSMALNDTATPSAGNGAVELVSGDRITAFYTDTAGDFGTAEYKRAQAFYAKTVVGGRTLIGDTIWGASGSPYLVTGDVTVDTGVTLVIQAGVKVLFLANSDDQSSGQRLSDSELLVKGTLSAVGTAEAPVVLSSSNAVASAGDWGGIYLEQNANLTLTYAHLSYTGYGINSVDNIKSVGITHSRLEFSGGGINLNRSYDQTSTRVITDNVINVGTSDHALTLGLNYNAADPIPNISRNTITNPQGHGIYVRNAYQGLTIDANTIAVKYTGIQVSSAGGVVAITNNILDNTSTSNWEKGSGVYVSSLRANGGADNAITSVTLQNNTIKKFGGSAGLYFNGNNQSITSSITGNTITDSDRQGVSIYNLQGTSITGNTVTGSAYAGVYLQNAVPSAFKDNVITGNGTTSNQPGLYISHSNAELSESFLIKDNDLSGNHIGIELRQFANAVVTGNDLSGSTTYGLNNLTTNAIDARYNYWGTSETTTLNAGGHPKALSFIYDGRDDAQYGSVNYAGWKLISPFKDDDADGIANDVDNCPVNANFDQLDSDSDGQGNVCDTDDDGDGLPDVSDPYPLASIIGYTDTDGDGRPDECSQACVDAGMAADTDDDNDGVPDSLDAFSLISLGGRTDTDNDGRPDDCDSACVALEMTADTDDDNDGITDAADGYPKIALQGVSFAFEGPIRLQRHFVNSTDANQQLLGGQAQSDSNPNRVSGLFSYNPKGAPDSPSSSRYANIITNYQLTLGSYKIGQLQAGEIRVVRWPNDHRLDFYMYPVGTGLIEGEEAAFVGILIGLSGFIDGYTEGDPLPDLASIFASSLTQGTSMIVEWSQSGRIESTLNMEVLLDSDRDGVPDECGAVCIGLGMVADADDDGDGVLDAADAYPLIGLGGLTDTDNDGRPNDCDSACVALGMAADTDDDNDGILDTADGYPLVAIGSLTDTDVDGRPNDCDSACVALGMAADADDDNDGICGHRRWLSSGCNWLPHRHGC